MHSYACMYLHTQASNFTRFHLLCYSDVRMKILDSTALASARLWILSCARLSDTWYPIQWTRTNHSLYCICACTRLEIISINVDKGSYRSINAFCTTSDNRFSFRDSGPRIQGNLNALIRGSFYSVTVSHCHWSRSFTDYEFSTSLYQSACSCSLNAREKHWLFSVDASLFRLSFSISFRFHIHSCHFEPFAKQVNAKEIICLTFNCDNSNDESILLRQRFDPPSILFPYRHTYRRMYRYRRITYGDIKAQTDRQEILNRQV